MADPTNQDKIAPVETKDDSITRYFISTSKVDFKFIVAGLILVLAIVFCVLHLFAAYFGYPEAHFYRSLHLTIVLILAYLLYPLGREKWDSRPNKWFLIDLTAIILIVVVELYYLLDVEGFTLRTVNPNQTDIIMGCILYVLVLEGTRRSLGPPMVIIAIFFTLHALFSDKMPWLLFGPPTSLKTLMLDSFMQEGGIFGMPLGAIASFVVLFLIFGALLQQTGTGKTFTDIAFSLFGRAVGGPAKAAVVGSSLFGMLSGSSVANVMTTGTITIPLMKQVGYRPVVAGAIEACSSTGGMFTPPLMGATAFVVAAFLGESYLRIIGAAALPALCYYVAVFAFVDFEARKMGIKPLEGHELPVLRNVLKEGFHLVVPIILLVAFLVAGYTASLACFWAIVGLFGISFLKKSSRLSGIDLMKVFEMAGRATVSVSLACAAAGIIVSATTLSGLGLRLGGAIVGLSQGQLWIALLIAAVLAVILGMGLTTTAVYIIMVVTVIPVIIQMGVPPIAAHMYALMFGVLSNIIPPVAIASFAAAGLAGSPPMATAAQAFRIGLPGLFVMVSFVYRPALLLDAPAGRIAWAAVTTIIAVVGLAGAINGYSWKRHPWIMRLPLAAGGLMSMSPVIPYAGIGSVIVIIILALNYIGSKRMSAMPGEKSAAAGTAGGGTVQS